MLKKSYLILIILALTTLILLSQEVLGQSPLPLPFDIHAHSAVLINAQSGAILYEKNPEDQLIPASLTKIMTLYLAFDALSEGQIKLTDEVTISRDAWKMGGSQMFIEVGQKVKFEDLLKGITVVSGNDACVAVAEAVAGSQPVFIKFMNDKAKSLGLIHTHFLNPHGLPEEGHYTTAKDMALLCYHYLKDHPEALKYHSIKEFTFGNITQQNRNGLIFRDSTVDGIKTGWTKEAGFHLIATARRNRDRFIAVVMGTKSVKEREEDAQALLTYGFKNFTTTWLCRKGEKAGEIKVWKGKKNLIALVPAEDGVITLPKGKEKVLSVKSEVPDSISAPVPKGKKIGRLNIFLEGNKIKEIDLVTSEEVLPGNILKQIFHSFILLSFYPPYIGLLTISLIIFLIISLKLIFTKKKVSPRL